MKISIINNIYPPYDRGGAEQVVVKTVEGLLAAGHEVVVITSSPKREPVERKDRLTVYRIHPRNLFFYTDAHRHTFFVRALWHLIDTFNFPTAREIEAILRTEHPEVVHTHNLMGLSFLLPRRIRRLNLRHVHTVHDVQLVEPSAMILKNKETSWRYTGLPTRLYTWLMKKLIGSPNVVISPSQFLLDFYRLRGFFAVSHCELVRNPVTFSFDLNTKATSAGEVINFLYLGQIERHKGVVILVSAFRELIADGKTKAKLHIVGSGSMLPEVQTMVQTSPNIIVYGRKDRKELSELFSGMDATVVPSLCYENSPTVIFESLAGGVPVLASNIEGIAELIKEGENGLTFTAGEVESLRAKMRWCIDHRAELETMSKKTTQSLVGLSIGEYVGRLEKLYFSVY